VTNKAKKIAQGALAFMCFPFPVAAAKNGFHWLMFQD
jgi:hypothetical protein